MGNGNIEGEEASNTLRSSVRKRLNQSRCVWVVGSDGPKESCCRSARSHMGRGNFKGVKGAARCKV